MERPVRRPQVVFGGFALIAALKVALLAIYGPIFVPDTSGYIAIAREIANSNAWLHDAQLSSGMFPPLAIRTIGYPAILAAAMQIGGPSWPYLTVALQFAVTMAALCAIFAMAIELQLSWRLALFAVVAFATCDQLVADQCILTDSLYANLIIFAVFILVRGDGSRQPLSLWGAVSAGGLLALAFLLREATPFLATTMLPLLALRAFRGCSRAHAVRSALACALAFLPLLATAEIYKAWNSHRSGERFVTTSAQATLMFALVNAAKHDHGVFDGETPIDRAARRTVRDYGFEDIAAINHELIEQGYRPTEIARMSEMHYFATWRNRPLAMLHMLRDHISEEAAKLAFRPLSASCNISEWATMVRHCPDYRDLVRATRSGFAQESLGERIFLALQTCELAVSIGVFSVFLLGAPLLWVSSWRLNGWPFAGRESLVLSLWAMYVGWFLLYAVVNMERRYINPVVPLSILGGLVVWQETVRSARARRVWPSDAADARTAET